MHIQGQGPKSVRVWSVKATVATTLKEGFVVGMHSMPGNPYDGYTLEEAIEQVSILAERTPQTVIVDRGYQGTELERIRIVQSEQKRGISRTLHAMIKRRSAIETTIGHMKTDGRLARNLLKGALGDALHAVLSGAGHNIRTLLKKLRLPLHSAFGQSAPAEKSITALTIWP
jgi:IS5 family transposase